MVDFRVHPPKILAQLIPRRFPYLPVGRYSLQANKDGAALGQALDVTVSLGTATNVNLGAGPATLITVQAVGSRATMVDVTSAASSASIDL